MSALREWMGAVAAASLLLALVRLLAPKGPLGDTADFIGGLILILVLLDPLVQIDPGQLALDTRQYRQAVEQRRQELETSQKAELKRRIEAGTESYISDKAQELGLELTVRVTAQAGENGVPVPVRAELWGAYSQALSQWMERSLDLPAERQVWNED